MSTHTIQGSEHAARNPALLARHLPTAARLLTGLVFLGSGIFGMLIALGIVPMPAASEPQPEAATAFMAALVKTGYLLQLIKGTEIVVGALLLSNRFVPFALVFEINLSRFYREAFRRCSSREPATPEPSLFADGNRRPVKAEQSA